MPSKAVSRGQYPGPRAQFFPMLTDLGRQLFKTFLFFLKLNEMAVKITRKYFSKSRL